MIKKISTSLLISILTISLYSQVTVERNLNLELVEKDSLKSSKIEMALNGFLNEAQENKYSEKYIDSTHLLKYKFFFRKLSGIGKNSEAYHKPLVLKSYPVENGAYRLTVGFTGVKKKQPFIYQITELKAVPYKNYYRFYCPFQDNTIHFKTKKIDNVTFYFSSSFKEKKAKKFVDFTHRLAKLTKTPTPKLDYYSFNSLDELLKSYGFLYSARQCNFLCYDLGFTDNQGKTYITGTNNENSVLNYIGDYLYYNLPNKDKLYWPYVVGIETYYGGYGISVEDDIKRLKKQFRVAFKNNPNMDFLEEFKKGRGSSINRHFSHYVMSAFLFEEVLNNKGFEKALELAYSGSKGEVFFEKLEQTIGINEKNFHNTILKLIEE